MVNERRDCSQCLIDIQHLPEIIFLFLVTFLFTHFRLIRMNGELDLEWNGEEVQQQEEEQKCSHFYTSPLLSSPLLNFNLQSFIVDYC